MVSKEKHKIDLDKYDLNKIEEQMAKSERGRARLSGVDELLHLAEVCADKIIEHHFSGRKLNDEKNMPEHELMAGYAVFMRVSALLRAELDRRCVGHDCDAEETLREMGVNLEECRI